METLKMWIGGKRVDAAGGQTYTAINPATGEEIAQVPLADRDDVEKAVAAARQALPVWSAASPAERSSVVNKIGTLLRENAEEFAKLDTRDHGTPITIARQMTTRAAETFEFNAQASRALMGQVIPIQSHMLHYMQREPVGVCALIIPWNVPLIMVASKLGAALSTGNTCVVKPPTIDSLTTLRLIDILEQVGLPPGTVNIITGPGGAIGEALASHPDVDLVSFTGSCETGKTVMALASQTTKRVVMELGGKNPFIVLPDADIDLAVSKAAFCTQYNSGQICASPGRYYLHESIHDEFVEKYVDAVAQLQIGDPQDEKTFMGPVVSAEHRDKVESYIELGIREGAKLILGGKRPLTPPLDRGFYVMPTAFTGVTQNMTIARAEIFGPVACFMKYSDQDDVVALANDNTYGLCASVWTRDVTTGIKLANKIRAGTIYINDHITIFPEMPWGGFRESGFGKENWITGLEEYTQLKVVAIELQPGS